MNKKQKIVFLVGIGIIVIMGLIPPWHYYAVYSRDQQIPIELVGGYEFLFSPSMLSGNTIPHIDLCRLLVQWAVVAIATAGIVLVLKDDKETSQKGG